MEEIAASPTKGRQRPYFSLKWKAVLVLSLILMAVNAALVMLGVGRLEGQLERHRKMNAERQVREFEALIAHSFSDLERIAPLILRQEEDASGASSDDWLALPHSAGSKGPTGRLFFPQIRTSANLTA